jgi:hypothetical protein
MIATDEYQPVSPGNLREGENFGGSSSDGTSWPGGTASLPEGCPQDHYLHQVALPDKHTLMFYFWYLYSEFPPNICNQKIHDTSNMESLHSA